MTSEGGGTLGGAGDPALPVPPLPTPPHRQTDRPSAAEVPWRGRDAAGAFVAAILAGALVVAVGPALDPAVAFPILASILGVVSVAWAAAYRRPGAVLGSGFRLGPRMLGMAALTWVAVFFLQVVIGLVVVGVLGPDAAPEAGGLPPEVAQGPPWSLILAVVVITPVAEELFFRGFLLQGLWRSFGSRVAVVVSALLFGLSHFGGASLTAVIPVAGGTAIGLVFGAMFVRTRNLGVTVVAHALVNGVAILLTVGTGVR